MSKSERCINASRRKLMTSNLKKYIKLKQKYDNATETEEQDRILEQLDELYFDLTEEEIAYLETEELNDY